MVEDQVNRHYDGLMFAPRLLDLYEDSLMNNIGYREDPTVSQSEACRTLINRLLEFAPENPEKILDVACGLGGTTRMLAEIYGPEKVVAINISDKQLAKCREAVPSVQFANMNATRLDFPDESFDLLLCVEAAFHFRTRQQFFQEAHRVLKPGGRLVLSDMLFGPVAQFRCRSTNPRENYVKDPRTYQSHLDDAGFTRTEVVDATDACWHSFYDYTWQRVKQRNNLFRRIVIRLILPRGMVTHIVLGWAEKGNSKVAP